LAGPGTPISSQATNLEGKAVFGGISSDSIRLTISAAGFQSYDHNLSISEQKSAVVTVVLSPASINSQVVVTATRTETRIGDTGASVAVLSAADLETSGALEIDDALRQTVGFSLFRRSSSRVA